MAFGVLLDDDARAALWDLWTGMHEARMHRLMTGEGMRHVYITTADAAPPGCAPSGVLVGLVRDALTHECLARTGGINPPHHDVARARAGELARERTDDWFIVDEPAGAP